MKSRIEKYELILKATARGKFFFNSEEVTEQFDRGCDHVHRLLRDAYSLYSSESYATSTFLSITSIEEIAKLEVAVYRNTKNTSHTERRGDLLFDHKSKHRIALRETITLGSRLSKAIGKAAINHYMDMADSGGLLKLRESALYINNENNIFTCPSDCIQEKTSREILLLALEIWDDSLVGMTNHSYEIDSELVLLFDNIVANGVSK